MSATPAFIFISSAVALPPTHSSHHVASHVLWQARQPHTARFSVHMKRDGAGGNPPTSNSEHQVPANVMAQLIAQARARPPLEVAVEESDALQERKSGQRFKVPVKDQNEAKTTLEPGGRPNIARSPL
eukprot:CAMPEP_0198308906 /NCGR_PEP_ID=MMETSP1450-20131203/1412_1 /TAXON_ID=753684 ORGANISM="Madagascaria erythrocladiodes, Strain CCMP3234" /NCGR_SAMPLE_ID=MMETSP1450 /ASSEMBLY_ACC=CAM_ASM_001115 /LENGTH=127 /DNA_ID=CAMNT_0044011623 /DNA_START=57 /DNA_END=441 /DNA_ORIENTATION=-